MWVNRGGTERPLERRGELLEPSDLVERRQVRIALCRDCTVPDRFLPLRVRDANLGHAGAALHARSARGCVSRAAAAGMSACRLKPSPTSRSRKSVTHSACEFDACREAEREAESRPLLFDTLREAADEIERRLLQRRPRCEMDAIVDRVSIPKAEWDALEEVAVRA